MKKKLVLCISAVVVIIACISMILVIKKKKDEDKLNLQKLQNDNEYFAEHLSIKGDFTYEKGKVHVDNYYLYSKELEVNVAYYNMFHDAKLTSDTLLSEYDAFCSGKNEDAYNDLILFCEYNNGGNHGECGVFRDYVSEYLHEHGYDTYEPAANELVEAIAYATEKFLGRY